VAEETLAKPKKDDTKKSKEAKKPAEIAAKEEKASDKADDDKKPAAKNADGFERLKKPDGEPDDLKELSGVGPVLEKTLNEFGIYHYRQIAGLKKADIAEIDEALNFKGRIERDDWIKQAKELAKKSS
jgi:predicted flap endonuclease-1-like 5' DNA nuclease